MYWHAVQSAIKWIDFCAWRKRSELFSQTHRSTHTNDPSLWAIHKTPSVGLERPWPSLGRSCARKSFAINYALVCGWVMATTGGDQKWKQKNMLSCQSFWPATKLSVSKTAFRFTSAAVAGGSSVSCWIVGGWVRWHIVKPVCRGGPENQLSVAETLQRCQLSGLFYRYTRAFGQRLRTGPEIR